MVPHENGGLHGGVNSIDDDEEASDREEVDITQEVDEDETEDGCDKAQQQVSNLTISDIRFNLRPAIPLVPTYGFDQYFCEFDFHFIKLPFELLLAHISFISDEIQTEPQYLDLGISQGVVSSNLAVRDIVVWARFFQIQVKSPLKRMKMNEEKEYCSRSTADSADRSYSPSTSKEILTLVKTLACLHWTRRPVRCAQFFLKVSLSKFSRRYSFGNETPQKH